MDKSFVFELIDRVKDSNIEEIYIETPDGKINIKQYTGPKEIYLSPTSQTVPASITQPNSISTTHVETLPKEKQISYHVIKSPLVGTFYRAPSPGAPPFVEEGDKVSKGQILCIIEALKVMNEIESDVDGKIIKILVENGQPVEYGQELFYVEV
ncbi:MAG: acetyl-CoA carboxylase biotin carboxyl carrier protein [Hydrogenothermaceae bacterium]|nr:acetyl-CoA carboxylase biotin carboxyl carrier protein [Hydrogenothermaceae bacterium]